MPKRLKFKCPVCGYMNNFINSTKVQDRSSEFCSTCEAMLVFSIEQVHVWKKRTGIGKPRLKRGKKRQS
jgi:transcription elongation factor Elf1